MLPPFNYKVVGDSNDCAVSSGYTNSGDMNPLALSVAAMSDGEVHICAVPVLTNGYIRPNSLANIFSYERDTECGNVNGDGQTKPYEEKEEDLEAINNAEKCLKASYKLMNDIESYFKLGPLLARILLNFKANLMVRFPL